MRDSHSAKIAIVAMTLATLSLLADFVGLSPHLRETPHIVCHDVAEVGGRNQGR